jgi:N-acylneuraminate cytidylyltransferase
MVSGAFARSRGERWLAIVPMKRHSERVPGKNVRRLAGEPLFFWILQTLSRVNAVGRIVVDTDGEEIASAVRQRFDVDVSMRPEALRGDFVPTNDLIRHVVSQYPQHDRVLQTHATNPLLRPETISEAIGRFQDQDACDSLFSVTRLQTRLYDADGRAVNHDPSRLLRTQDLAPMFEENSNLYLFTRESFAQTGSRIGRRPLLFEMSKLEALDIDEEGDFLLADALLSSATVAHVASSAV